MLISYFDFRYAAPQAAAATPLMPGQRYCLRRRR